ncbi:MAG: bacteriohemerythrin [Geobacteraceae bacterium]|nr:bacteriohemerythrin [Geobacteraceae bacterium]
MPLFSWRPEYSVNDPALDIHHRKLFDILNAVYENVMNSLEVDNVLPAINELSAYTKYHLMAEERYMREKGFQGIDAHIAEHRLFTHKIEMLKTNYHGNNMEVTQELIVLLGEWLLQHVIREDRKY